MSMTKRIIDEADYIEGLVSSLQRLEEFDHLDHDAANGVTKKIIAENSLGGLTARQSNVFREHIEPILNRRCEGCDAHIHMQNVEDALLHESGTDEYLCGGCIHQRGRYG